MSTNLQEIHKILNNLDLENKIDTEIGLIITGIGSDIYTDSDGKHGIQIIMHADENGEFFRIIAPNLYINKHSLHEMATLQTCMHVTSHTKLVKCLYNESNKEICIQIDLPLEDNTISSKQVSRILGCLIETVEMFDPAFRSAIDTGDVITMKIFAEKQQQAKLAELIKNAPAEEIENLIQQLEFLNISHDSNHDQQRVLN